jgi:hypothetical protein
MKIQYRQKESGGCSFYAVAHLLQDEKMLKYAVPGEGNNTYHVNRALEKEGHNLYLDPLLVLCNTLKRYARITDAAIFKFDITDADANKIKFLEEHVRAYYCCFYRPEVKRYHAVAVLQDVLKNNFYFIDSTLDKVKKYRSAAKMIKEYHFTDVYILQDIAIKNPETEFVFLKKWLFGSLITDYKNYIQ